MGRPKLDEPMAETQGKMAEFLSHLRKYGSIRSAASFAGVRQQTVQKWEERWPDFAEQLQLAKAEAARNMHTAMVDIALDPNHKRQVDALRQVLPIVHEDYREVDRRGQAGPVSIHQLIVTQVPAAQRGDAILPPVMEAIEATVRELPAGDDE